jgi:hypothetical protein
MQKIFKETAGLVKKFFNRMAKQKAEMLLKFYKLISENNPDEKRRLPK